MDMPVEMERWLEDLDEPAKSLDPPVRQIRLIMDPAGWRMGNQDIQKPAVLEAVAKNAGEQGEDIPPHLGLIVLKRTWVVAQAALDPCQQQTLMVDHFPVQVKSPVR